MSPRQAAMALGVLALLAAIGAGLLASSSPIAASAVAVGVVGFALIHLFRLSMADLIVAFMPIMFFPPIGITLNMSVADFLLPVLALAALGRMRRTELSVDQMKAIKAAAQLSALFLAAVAVATVIALLTDENASLQLAVVDGMKLLVCISYFIFLTVHLTSSSDLERIRTIKVWVWVASVQGLGSVAGLLPSDGVRSLGYFQDPNLYAAYLLVSLGLVFYLVMRRELHLWPLHVLALVLGILSTGSRGALITAALLIMATLLLLGFTRVGIFVGGFVGSALLLLALTPARLLDLGLPGVDRLATSAGNSAEDPRLNLWAKAIELWGENPVLGVGLGQYTRFSHGLTPYVGDGIHGQVTHNTFLSFGTEVGIVGLFFFLLLLAFPFRAYIRSQDALTPPGRAMLIGGVALAGMMMTLNLQNLRYPWAFLAILLALSAAPSVPTLKTTPPTSRSKVDSNVGS